MEQLHRDADKLFNEVDHLDQLFDRSEEFSEGELALAISIVKRVRRDSTILLRNLAEIRDNKLHA